MKQNYLKISDLIKAPTVFIYLLAAVLISLPLKYAFGSFSCVIFLVVSFSFLYKSKFSYNTTLVLPMIFYLLMVISLSWTTDFQSTLMGLKKEAFFFLIPLAFLVIPKLNKESTYRIFRIYSFAMVLYALYYFVNAICRYAVTGNSRVFFYHELVTLDLNAIYVSTFASFALFYFILIKSKSAIEQLATIVLVILIAFLSSRTMLFIDFLVFICYYIFFSETHKGIKTITVFVVSLFFVLSLIFVSESRKKLLTEYETAIVDNTVDNDKILIANQKVYDVSVKEAWHNNQFQPNNFLPGIALRVFQTRIFIQMLQEQNILFTGFGFDASQEKIKEKAKRYNLSKGYEEFNFHNQYVQTFAELGLFGFIMLVSMLYINIKNAWDHKSFLHIVFSITMIMLFLSESFLSRQRGVVFFITIYCLFNTINSSKPNKKQEVIK